MARDIEEFLRKAAERRKQQQQNRQRGPAPSDRVREIIEQDVEVVQPVEIVKPAQRKKQLVRNKPQQRKQLVQPKPQRDLSHESVSDHVRSHIDSSSISEHAEHLGERIQDADDRIAARLHRKFDHDVSKLDDLPSVQDDVVATVTKEEISGVAKDLLHMLRNPKTIRQAIMVSEILKRPDFD